MFECKRCGYQASTKCNILKHLDRVNICDPKLSNASTESLKSEFSKKKIEHKNDDPICSYCQKQFQNISNVYRHQKTCPKRPKNVIVLRNYADEKNDHITDDLMLQFSKDCSFGITNFIKNVYFNHDIPENHILKIKSRKQSLVELYQDSKWMIKDKNETLTMIIQATANKLFMTYQTDIDHEIFKEKHDFVSNFYNKIREPSSFALYTLRRSVFANLVMFTQELIEKRVEKS